jgi:hypothetical protein
MDYDLLLSWASERGRGSLTSFRHAHDWLAGQHPSDTQHHWIWTLQSLQALGHLEVSRARRRWEAAPPTIATMPNGGGYAFLCGARPTWLLRRIDGLDDDPTLGHLAQSILLERPIPQDSGPALQLLTLESDQDIHTLCTALGLRYAGNASDQLAAVLPPLSASLSAGRRGELPGGVFPTRMGDGQPGTPLFSEVVEDLTPRPGGYCTRLYDVARYFYVHTTGDVFEASRGEVVYAELRREGRHVLRWSRRESALLVPARMRLPELYERAAVLRTGLLPQPGHLPGQQPGHRRGHGAGLWLAYLNVDLGLASRLAQGLGQQVQVVDDDTAAAAGPAQPRRLTQPTQSSARQGGRPRPAIVRTHGGIEP